MTHYLDSLRKKPLWYRRRIVVAASIAITAVVIVVWLSTISGTISSITSEKSNLELSPLDHLKDNFAAAYGDVTRSIGMMKDVISGKGNGGSATTNPASAQSQGAKTDAATEPNPAPLQ